MVIFVATLEGYRELETIILTGKYPVWVGAGVLTENEIDEVRERGVNLTNFLYPVDIESSQVVDQALGTIALHHHNDRIWSECRPCMDQVMPVV